MAGAHRLVQLPAPAATTEREADHCVGRGVTSVGEAVEIGALHIEQRDVDDTLMIQAGAAAPPLLPKAPII